MEDLLLGLLWCVFEFIGEVILEFVFGVVADVSLRSLGEAFQWPEAQNPVLASTGSGLLGVILGGVSVLIFPHPLLRPSKFHGISLIASPVLTGLMLSWTGAFLRGLGKKATQLESFGYGFLFAFGMALVRGFFAR